MNKLKEIRERVRKATKGPWVTSNDDNVFYCGKVISVETIQDICIDPEFDDRPNDRDFIAHARTDIPYLLLLVDLYEAALGEITKGGSCQECIEDRRHLMIRLDSSHHCCEGIARKALADAEKME